MAPRSVCLACRRVITDVKQRWSVIRWGPKIYYLELFRALESTLNYWSRLHLQSLAPNNPRIALVVGYGPFSLCVIHKVYVPEVGTLIG
jgi:hypothetical protein